MSYPWGTGGGDGRICPHLNARSPSPTNVLRQPLAGHAGSVAALLDSADALTHLDHLVAATGEGQRTPLMLAAARGHARVIRLLLTHNPEGQVAAVDTGKMTALMLAAEAGSRALRGADWGGGEFAA